MTIQEAIEHCKEIASKGCDKCAQDHKQLAEWLEELVERRKLGWHHGSERPLPPAGKKIVVYYNDSDGVDCSHTLKFGYKED